MPRENGLIGLGMAEHWYQAHGLSLRSAFAVPELAPGSRATRPDIEIGIGAEAGAALDAARACPEASDDAILAVPAGGSVFEVPDLGAFWVRGGSEIRITLRPGADEGLMHLFLLGSAIGLALHQRGYLVMHAASVAREGRATLFVGDSGAGKSTLAAMLGQGGFPILGDDTVALHWNEGAAAFEVWPGGTSFKLWRDALAATGFDPAGLPMVAARTDKFYLPNPSVAEPRPYLVDEVLVLAAAPGDGLPALEPLGPLEAVRELVSNTYRPHFVTALGQTEAHFVQCVRLAETVSVARLTRPWSHARAADVRAFLASHWAGRAA